MDSFQRTCPLVTGGQVGFTVFANDKFNLTDVPNTGAGERYALDVVSPAELLRMLERLEADQHDAWNKSATS